MNFDRRYFSTFTFSQDQVRSNLANAKKDLYIAENERFPEVRFAYAYNALIKAGITLLNHNRQKVKSVPGHHVRIIDALAGMLKDESIADMGHVMRIKRNRDLYDGGTTVTEKEGREYLAFVISVVDRVGKVITG